MTKSRTFNCLCCGETKAIEQFTNGSSACITCAGLPPDNIIALTRNTVTREVAQQQDRKGNKLAMRRDRYLQRYIDDGGKRCSAGWHLKPIEAFDACAPRTDGLQPACKACNKLRATIMATAPLGTGKATWHTVQTAMRSLAPPQIGK